MATKQTSKSKAGPGTGGVDLQEVERLLEFMAKHGLEEFEYERSGFRIRLRKPFSQPTGFSRAISAPEIVVAAANAPAHHAATAAAQSGREASGEAGRAGSEDVHVVKSPIVGTFYAAPTVGGEPFVTVGSRVEAGQALCIIEAMKLMNEIESDVAGEVVKIFVENGQPVEYGEALFGIHPHRKK
ncbi:MAG TPA: acetyl-CoA carboxylase biotin carboxyl carrier protein [Candidatus Acidoferrales bacterium]|jgi:acetyl-CoA carboxylase biotin carboxyl carrier protein|nr:acetyl-CoA carboxylase biotin carboxyl carrier protein [Candidatus Acidoferrales bacterium]